MKSFLQEVVLKERELEPDPTYTIYVLPNNRSGLFLKKEIKNLYNGSILFPKIISIQKLTEEITDFQTLDQNILLLEFYQVYKKVHPHDPQSFDQFSSWASILLQDFNELDGQLAEVESLFIYLADLKRIDALFQDSQENSDITKNYLKFIEDFPTYYKSFKEFLTTGKVGYPGLISRYAAEKVVAGENPMEEQYVFIGFNALLKSEEVIIQTLLKKGNSRIYWDFEAYYQENNIGLFIDHFRKKWKYFESTNFNWVKDNLSAKKKIDIYGTPLNVSQVKLIANLLNQAEDKKNNFQNTAIVLADENLLPVVLNSLPEDVKSVNITMGINLERIHLSALFSSIFKMHVHQKRNNSNSFFYKDLFEVVDHVFIKRIIGETQVKTFQNQFIKSNQTFFSKSELLNVSGLFKNIPELGSVLIDWEDPGLEVLDKLIRLTEIIEQTLSINFLEKEYLLRFNQLFKQLKFYQEEYGFSNNINTLYLSFKEFLKQEKLSFKGEPLSGLQIMGVLESRVLDFENLIFISVNEGVLPKGNTGNSFITFETRSHFGLPTYKEKDPIYGYHFFRLLQRAKNIQLIYNNQTSNFGEGEQSRFITQMEISKELGRFPNWDLGKSSVVFKNESDFIPLKNITKNQSLILALNQLAKEGISPSSLTSYIRNPLDFYKRKILKIKEIQRVEEEAAQNTFGTIVHNSLQNLYLPYVGKLLTEEGLKNSLSKVDEEVENQFSKEFCSSRFFTGKNFINLTIAKKYIHDFINLELKIVRSGKKIRILDLETNLELDYFSKKLNKNFLLKGIADRIDEMDGILRIIDYKTGKVQRSDLTIKDWNDLILDEKKSKAFQVLFYAFVYKKQNNYENPMISGIYSFKNFKEGFLPFKNSEINQEDLENFEEQLDLLFEQIFDFNIPFIEKEIKKFNY